MMPFFTETLLGLRPSGISWTRIGVVGSVRSSKSRHYGRFRASARSEAGQDCVTLNAGEEQRVDE